MAEEKRRGEKIFFGAYSYFALVFHHLSGAALTGVEVRGFGSGLMSLVRKVSRGEGEAPRGQEREERMRCEEVIRVPPPRL